MSVNKVKIILIISITCWVLLTLFIIFLFWLSGLQPTDKPNMIGKKYEDVVAFRYNSSGDMIGAEIDISLETEDEILYITYFTRKAHNDEGVTKKVKAPASALEEINALFYKCEIQKLGKLKKSKIQELDGSTVDIEFITAEKHYRIFSNEEIPEKAENVISESYKILIKYCED